MQLWNEGRAFENQKLKWHVFVSIDASKKSELWCTVCCMLPCRSKTAGGTVLAEGHCAPRWIIAASFGGRVFLDGIRRQIIRRTKKQGKVFKRLHDLAVRPDWCARWVGSNYMLGAVLWSNCRRRLTSDEFSWKRVCRESRGAFQERRHIAD